MVQVLPHARGAYCMARSVLIAEECHLPLEPGWFHEPRGIRKGEVFEADVMTEVASFFMDNSLNLPVGDTLVISLWATSWLLYCIASISIAYTIAWCLCWRATAK